MHSFVAQVGIGGSPELILASVMAYPLGCEGPVYDYPFRAWRHGMGIHAQPRGPNRSLCQTEPCCALLPVDELTNWFTVRSNVAVFSDSCAESNPQCSRVDGVPQPAVLINQPL